MRDEIEKIKAESAEDRLKQIVADLKLLKKEKKIKSMRVCVTCFDRR